MKQTVGARLYGMAADEILLYVPTQTYLEIKRKDPTPIFKAFVVGGEGTWSPTLVGIGSVIQRWYRSAVQKIVTLLERWTPVFHLHSTATEDEGRPVIGRVVGRAEKMVDGILNALAIIYILPEYQGLELDIASIEADVNVSVGEETSEVKDVNVLGVTGIALGNSSTNKPAFAGATLLASLQAFAETNKPGGKNIMTPAELKAAIREARLRPSELFELRDLMADPAIEEEMREKAPANHEFARMRRELKDAEQRAREFEDKATKATSELETTRKKADDLSKATLRTSAKDTLAAILKERKLVDDAGKPKDEKFSKFIERNVEKSFAPKEEGSLKTDLNKFLDGLVDEYKDLVGEPGVVQKPGGGGTPGEPVKPAAVDPNDLTLPENNPLIPK